jgi:hypothetical protein
MTSKIIIRFLNARIPGAELKETNRSYKRPAFYLIKTASGQCYGGSTSSRSKRLSRHTFDLRKGIHPIAELQKAYDAGIDITVDVTYAGPSRPQLTSAHVCLSGKRQVFPSGISTGIFIFIFSPPHFLFLSLYSYRYFL